MGDQLFPTSDSSPAAPGSPVPAPDAPLAVRMRPRILDDVVGQQHLLGTLEHPTGLRRAIAEGRPHSMLLHGPPGTGKTTLARLVAGAADAAFEELSAVQAGRAEVRAVIARATHRRETGGQATIFFLDEIHRFNKAQQDALLPAVEEGLVTLIGATTENPYFEVNAALLSRTRIYELHALEAGDIEVLLRRAIERGECAAAAVSDDVIAFLAGRAGGDARTALAALELACASVDDGEQVTLQGAEEALQRKAINFDRAGDQHYDYISAWIKATRASDPDAALYYLAVMLEGGEDPRFIVRRMVILASEDIGNADPQALVVATAAVAAVEHVGLPECVHTLSQATIYLALAPKSKAATRSIGAAMQHVRTYGAAPPPAQIRSRAIGYDDPHKHPGHLGPQEVAPDDVAGTRFYEPDDMEAPLRERLAEIRRARGRSDEKP
ncbi:MAG: putative ATPase [Solirubrobacteraceae bacterium]|nr:putative ATPase [Solirubrobacteraceae bacterium]